MSSSSIERNIGFTRKKDYSEKIEEQIETYNGLIPNFGCSVRKTVYG